MDPGTRRVDRGRTLIGGSPLRVMRVTDAGARAVDEFTAGAPVGDSPSRVRLARHLVDSGMAHPSPAPADPARLAAVHLVVPVRDDAAGITALLDALGADGTAAAVGGITIVDDGSGDPDRLRVAVDGRAAIIRREHAGGPGPARDTGWRAVDAEFVAFVDADVTPEPGWLATLVAHFADPLVGAVAPRVRAPAAGRSASALDRYERNRSPLDLGPGPGAVGPTARIRYVPSATLVVRRTVLEALDGFDPALRFGEDVDLVWRAVAAGHRIRYVPEAGVVHRNRPDWAGVVRQRRGYGSSAAALDRRHPGSVPPVALNAWSLAAWTLAVFGGRRGRVAGLAVAGAAVAALVPKLADHVDRPVSEAFRLGGGGTVAAGRWLGQAITRTWLPIAVVGSLRSRRVAKATAAAIVVPAVMTWRDSDRSLDVGRWTAAHLLDDAAYCLGVWDGCRRGRSWRILLPRVTGIDGIPSTWRTSREPG